MAATVTLSNEKQYASTPVGVFSYALTGSAVYPALTVPSGYTLIGLNANFGHTVGDSDIVEGYHLQVDPSNKTVFIYTGTVKLLTGTFTIYATAVGVVAPGQ